MIKNDQLLEDLQQLLKHKKSKVYYSEKLGISEEEVSSLMKELKNKEISDTINDLHDFETTKFQEDISKGEAQLTFRSYDEIHNLEELILHANIDTEKWEITKYVQNYWGNDENPHYQVKAWLSLKKGESKFQENFIKFLENYKPSYKKEKKKEVTSAKQKISLILPKQDAHFDKLDIKGNNDIEDRFNLVDKSIWNMLKKASSVNYIEEIVYIVGSDQFNSEWTSATTKGTNQSNILSYQDSFKCICDHEIGIINNLIDFADRVKVIFIPGNHDEYVGWHLIHFLETFFRNITNISFDSKLDNTKYHKYGNSGIMLNHGDAIKPKDLAQKFPIGFKEYWSSCDNYYIFTGDKHHEMSLDIHGIKFYQVPQLSKSTSKWDDKMGYTDSKAEMTAFVITEENGMSDIYKDIL